MKVVFLQKLLLTGLQVLTILMISANTDAKNFGQLTVYLSALAYLSGIFVLGANRHANYYKIDHPFAIRNIKFLYTARIFLYCICCIAVFLLIAERSYWLEILTLALFLATYREYHRYCRVQAKHIKCLNIEILFVRIIPFVCVLITIYFAAFSVIEALLYSYIFGSLLTCVAMFIVMDKPRSGIDLRTLDTRYLFGSWLYDIIALASRDLEVVFIAIFIDFKSAGLYFLGKKLFGIMSLINDASQFLFEQKLSSSDEVQVNAEYYRQRNINLIFGIVLFLVISLCAYIYDTTKSELSQYIDTGSVLLNEDIILVILVFGIARLVESSIGPYNSLLLMTRNFTRAYFVEILVLLTKLVVCFTASMSIGEHWYVVLPFIRSITLIIGRKVKII